MRITIMVHNLTGGGAERVAALWASGFAERGYSVKLLIQNATKHIYCISDLVEIVQLKKTYHNRIITYILSWLGITRRQYLSRLNDYLKTEKPDVFIGVMGSYARDAYILTKNTSINVIQTYHSPFDLPEIVPANRRRDIAKCYSLDKDVKYRTVLTQADKDYIGDRMQNVFVLPNPLAFNPLDAVPAKQKYVLACGRLDVWDYKGFDVLINGWGLIAKKHSSWKLRIAGTGSEKSLNFLKKLAERNNVSDQVEFMGFRNDVVELYKESEIFVLSSRYEGFGLVLIEAMSQGCACVACDYKGRQREIIENETQGLTCEVDNPQSLAQALNKMIEDDKYREMCQRNSLIRSAYFSVTKTIERWESIFHQIGAI